MSWQVDFRNKSLVEHRGGGRKELGTGDTCWESSEMEEEMGMLGLAYHSSWDPRAGQAWDCWVSSSTTPAVPVAAANLFTLWQTIDHHCPQSIDHNFLH